MMWVKQMKIQGLFRALEFRFPLRFFWGRVGGI